MAVIPIQSGQQDLEEAMKAFSFVRAVEKQTGRTVPALAIRMRTNAAIEDMVERKIAAQLETEGHPVCKLRLYDKAAYRAIYQEGCLLQDLHEYSSMGGVERARETAALLIPALADAYKTALDLKEPA